MASIELIGTLNVLKEERAKMHGGLAKLDKAIIVLEELTGTNTVTSNGHAGKRTLSAAARRKIGKAQKARWAKVRRAQKVNG